MKTTTITSVYGRAWEIGPWTHKGQDCVLIRPCDEEERIFNRAELLEALDAVPYAELEVAAKRGRAAEARVRELTDKLDAAIATINDIEVFITISLDPHHQDSVVAARVAEKLRAIINPAPAFELPTEAGAKFQADLTQNGEARTFTTFEGAGTTLYAYEDARYGWYVYDSKTVFEDFTNHRPIGADQ